MQLRSVSLNAFILPIVWISLHNDFLFIIVICFHNALLFRWGLGDFFFLMWVNICKSLCNFSLCGSHYAKKFMKLFLDWSLYLVLVYYFQCDNLYRWYLIIYIYHYTLFWSAEYQWDNAFSVCVVLSPLAIIMSLSPPSVLASCQRYFSLHHPILIFPFSFPVKTVFSNSCLPVASSGSLDCLFHMILTSFFF